MDEPTTAHRVSPVVREPSILFHLGANVSVLFHTSHIVCGGAGQVRIRTLFRVQLDQHAGMNLDRRPQEVRETRTGLEHLAKAAQAAN